MVPLPEQVHKHLYRAQPRSGAHSSTQGSGGDGHDHLQLADVHEQLSAAGKTPAAMYLVGPTAAVRYCPQLPMSDASAVNPGIFILEPPIDDEFNGRSTTPFL